MYFNVIALTIGVNNHTIKKHDSFRWHPLAKYPLTLSLE